MQKVGQLDRQLYLVWLFAPKMKLTFTRLWLYSLCVILHRFASLCCNLQHFASYYTIVHHFASFCIIFHRFASFCIVLHRFASFWFILHRFVLQHWIFAPKVEYMFKIVWLSWSFAVMWKTVKTMKNETASDFWHIFYDKYLGIWNNVPLYAFHYYESSSHTSKLL